MIRFQKRNVIWLGLLAVLMALVVISPNINPAVQAVLLGVFILAMIGTVVGDDVRQRLLSSVTDRVSGSSRRMSPQAREAQERAQSRSSYYKTDLDMIDVGVIASQIGPDGMVMRRTRTISKDDDGARPFVAVFIPPAEAERNANVDFSFIDQSGKEIFSHTQRVYLRDGEMNILSDHHLPLHGNDAIAGIGDWDLRVSIDGILVGIHSFGLTASSEERRRRVSGNTYYEMGDESQSRQDRLTARDLSAPTSLEDLLRNDDDQRRR